MYAGVVSSPGEPVLSVETMVAGMVFLSLGIYAEMDVSGIIRKTSSFLLAFWLSYVNFAVPSLWPPSPFEGQNYEKTGLYK